MNLLIERIKGAPFTTWEDVSGTPPRERKFIEALPKNLWKEIRWFFDEIDDVCLFCADDDEVSRSNGCAISSDTLTKTVFDLKIGSPTGSQLDYMVNYRVLGFLPTGGMLAIGCAEECFGKIADAHPGLLSHAGNVPIVAKTFAEYLERTLDAGPDAEDCYWHLPGFEDLGPAIPGDPYYMKPAC